MKVQEPWTVHNLQIKTSAVNNGFISISFYSIRDSDNGKTIFRDRRTLVNASNRISVLSQGIKNEKKFPIFQDLAK